MSTLEPLPLLQLREGGEHADKHLTSLVLRPYSQIRPERVTWLWDGRIAAGVLTLLVGLPGLGKTMLMVWLAARLSRGELGQDAMSVLYCTAEDSPEHTLSPRLRAAAADLDRIHDVQLRCDGLDDGLTLPDDIDALREAVERVGAGLVVIDPLMAHLAGGIDSHRDHSIRRALAPIHKLGQETGCTPLVIGHLNKAPGTDLFARVGGSIGLTAAARSILLMTPDPERADDEAARLLIHGKNSLGPPSPTLRCRVAATEVKLDDGPVWTARMELGEEAGHIHVADVLGAPDGQQQTLQDEAEEFLRAELTETIPVKDLRKRARDAGLEVDWRTVRRAYRRMGGTPHKSGFSGGWEWPPPERDKAPKESVTQSAVPFEGATTRRPASHEALSEEDRVLGELSPSERNGRPRGQVGGGVVPFDGTRARHGELADHVREGDSGWPLPAREREGRTSDRPSCPSCGGGMPAGAVRCETCEAVERRRGS